MTFRPALPAALLAGLLALGPTAAAYADPPPWAPAHGYRAKEDKHKHKRDDDDDDDRRTVIIREVERPPQLAAGLPAFYGLPVGIEQGRCDHGLVQANMGTVLGAIAGGLAGSQFGKGDGQVAMTAAGVLLGAVLGNVVQGQLDPADQGCLTQALERAPTGQPVVWNNPDSGARYQVTPVRTYEPEPGRHCRDYKSRATIGGRAETVTGTACRQPDGTWRIVG